MRTIWLARRIHYLLVLGSVSLVPACADSPSEPQAAAFKKVPGVTRAMSYIDGPTLVVVDQALGLSLTLDATAQEIRISDGRVFLLSTEQTTQFVTDFMNIIAFDQLVNAVNTMGGAGECGDVTGCEEPYSIGLPIFVNGSDAPPRNRMGSLGGRVGRFGIPPSRQPTKSDKGFALPAPAFDWVFIPDCQTLKGQVIQTMAAYLNHRADKNRNMLGSGLSGFIFGAGRWIKDLTTPDGIADMANVLSDMVNLNQAETQLNMMRVLYTSQGCGVITWGGQSRESYGGRPVTCISESKWISFDGGQTARRVWADVCSYAMS